MKFSIILPTYNRADTYLKDAIDSVVNQSYINWELLIIDNHSTDNTDELIGSYKDDRIKLYKIRNNGNIAKSRNLGISKADGNYIALIDSDDFWHRDKLKLVSEYLSIYPNDGLCHSEYWLNEDGMSSDRHYGSNGFSYNSLLINGNCLSLSAVIVHSKIIKELDGFSENINFITAEDYDLWLKLANYGYKIKFIDELLGTYRIHQSSESSNVSKNIKAISSVIEYHCKKNKFKVRKKNKCLANVYHIAGKTLQLNNSKLSSLNYYLNSIKHYPMQLKSYIFIITLLIPHKLLIIMNSKIN